MSGTFATFRGFMDCLDHVEEAEHIVGYEAWNKGDIIGNPAVEQAYVAGRNV